MRLQNRLVPLSAGYPLATSDTGADWSLLAANYPMEGREETASETQSGQTIDVSDESGEQRRKGGGEEGTEERGAAQCKSVTGVCSQLSVCISQSFL